MEQEGIRDPRHQSELLELASPEEFCGSLAIGNCSEQELLSSLRMMLLIRYCEEEIGGLVVQGEARCPCHLGIGQEAVAVGVSSFLTQTDRVYGGHRSHAHYLALGGSVDELFSEVLGRADGCSGGMGGSMHLTGRSCGFIASVPIVGATIPIAVGAALAAQKDKSSAVAVAYFGDGATEEGVFHESLNFASTYCLPVLFVCENNLYSSHLDIKLRQPSDMVSRFALAHRVEARLVDGNDLMAVRTAASELVNSCRQGGGPGFIEAVTYRWRGHVGPNEDIDVGVRRTPGDLARWKGRDPIRRLKDALIQKGIMDEATFSALDREVVGITRAASRKAREAAFPVREFLLSSVYP